MIFHNTTDQAVGFTLFDTKYPSGPPAANCVVEPGTYISFEPVNEPDYVPVGDSEAAPKVKSKEAKGYCRFGQRVAERSPTDSGSARFRQRIQQG